MLAYIPYMDPMGYDHGVYKPRWPKLVYAILQVIPALFHSKHPQRMWIQWGGIFIKVHSWDHLGFTTVYS